MSVIRILSFLPAFVLSFAGAAGAASDTLPRSGVATPEILGIVLVGLLGVGIAVRGLRRRKG